MITRGNVYAFNEGTFKFEYIVRVILAKRSIFSTIKLQDTATKISDALLQFIYSLYIIYKNLQEFGVRVRFCK